MLEDFLSYIEANLSVIRKDNILLSVSGGVDSMVMLHMFKELDYNISVAHINHSTRNGASDQDLVFVESICSVNSIPFYSKTLNYEDLSQGNFQENARSMRFEFLSRLQQKHGFNWIATAHHKDDRWETFLMHLNRKSGIQGLTSLRGKENQVIHPLLIFTKAEIINYAIEHDIKYVHDVSNDSTDYLRNKIRHTITPPITETFPNFILNVNQSINYLENDHHLLHELIDKSDIISYDKRMGYLIIDLHKIKTFVHQSTLLFHIIEKYGFNNSDTRDILRSKIGSMFLSSDFEALLDRERLIVREKKEKRKIEITCHAPGQYKLADGKNISIDVHNPLQVPKHLWLDNEKVTWPLTIRHIKPGDKFKPDGMKGSTKSIKKLCTDLKINRFAKENLLVVCQNEKILQIIGIKTSHNYIASNIKNALTFNIVE